MLVRKVGGEVAGGEKGEGGKWRTCEHFNAIFSCPRGVDAVLVSKVGGFCSLEGGQGSQRAKPCSPACVM